MQVTLPNSIPVIQPMFLCTILYETTDIMRLCDAGHQNTLKSILQSVGLFYKYIFKNVLKKIKGAMEKTQVKLTDSNSRRQVST